MPGPDCQGEGEECEGFEWITFDLDAKGKIVGIAVSAAACPLVYVEQAGGAFDYQGEILRNLAKPAWEATQQLRLDTTCDGEVRVQLVEAKDEITYLDDVALVVGGVAVAPRACGEANPPAYCGDDGRFATLVPRPDPDAGVRRRRRLRGALPARRRLLRAGEVAHPAGVISAACLARW